MATFKLSGDFVVSDGLGTDSEKSTDDAGTNEGRLFTEMSTSSLESLPPELRLQLLSSMPDLPTLRSLVRASPVMHAQYLENRNTILRTCLARELDGYILDACALLVARVSVLGRERTDEKITNYLDAYRSALSGNETFDANFPRDGEVRWLARYQLRVARPLASLYSSWALENLSTTTASGPEEGTASGTPVQDGIRTKLSKSEEIRIFRALYRYDIYYRLFGRNQGRRIGAFRHHVINDIFFGLFHPWEAEAIGCFDLFVRHTYHEIFDKVKEDLHEDNPRFIKNGAFNPSGSHDLTVERKDYMDGTISRGLEMLVRILSIKTHDELVAKMDRYLTHDQNLDYSVEKSLSTLAQDDRRGMLPSYPNSKDEAELRRESIEFVGDTISPDGPPFAWVLLWDGKYSNIYGEYVPKCLRQLGYVIWDKKRWVDAGAQAFVSKQWEDHPNLVQEIQADVGWRPISSNDSFSAQETNH